MTQWPLATHSYIIPWHHTHVGIFIYTHNHLEKPSNLMPLSFLSPPSFFCVIHSLSPLTTTISPLSLSLAHTQRQQKEKEMCRLTAYIGTPIVAADLVTRPNHSIITQSFAARERLCETHYTPPCINVCVSCVCVCVCVYVN